MITLFYLSTLRNACHWTMAYKWLLLSGEDRTRARCVTAGYRAGTRTRCQAMSQIGLPCAVRKRKSMCFALMHWFEKHQACYIWEILGYFSAHVQSKKIKKNPPRHFEHSEKHCMRECECRRQH